MSQETRSASVATASEMLTEDLELLAQDASGIRRVPSLDFVALLPQLDGNNFYKTWADLVAVTGAAGDGAQVVDTDTGTHTDPVVGGTVNNAGIFRWSVSPAGWERIADTITGAVSASAATASAAADTATDALTDINSALDDILVEMGHTAFVLDSLPLHESINESRIENGLPTIDLPESPYGIPAPYRAPDGTPALYDFAPDDGLFWFNRRQRRSSAAFISDTLGVVTGDTMVSGPYEAPDAANLVTNSAFINTTGWGSSRTLDVAALDGTAGTGTLKFTVAGASGQDAYFEIPDSNWLAFRFTAKVRKGTGSQAVSVSAGSSGGLNHFNSTATNSTSFVEYTIRGGVANTNAFVGMQISGSPAVDGTYFLDDPVAVRVDPLAGFTQNDFTQIVTAPPPGTPSGTKTLGSLDNDSTRDWCRIDRNAAGEIIVRSKVTNSESPGAAFNLGAVPDGDDIMVAVAWKSGAVVAALNGGAPYTAAGTKRIPAVFKLREACAVDGSNYGQRMKRTTIVNGAMPNIWLQNATIPKSVLAWILHGDSGVAGAAVGSGGSIVSILDNIRTDRLAMSTAASGSTRTEQLELLKSTSYLRASNRPVFWWNYGPATEGDYAAQVALIDEFVRNVGHEGYLIGRSIAVDTASADLVNLQVQLRDYVVNTYGAVHSWDALPIMQDMGDGGATDNAAIDAGKPPPSILPDTTHYNEDAAMELYTDATEGLGRGLDDAMAAIETLMGL